MGLLKKLNEIVMLKLIWAMSEYNALTDEAKVEYYTFKADRMIKKGDLESSSRSLEERNYYDTLIGLRGAYAVGFSNIKKLSSEENLPKILEENNFKIVELFSNLPKNQMDDLIRKYHRKFHLGEIAGYCITSPKGISRIMAQIKTPFLSNPLAVFVQEN